MGCYHDRPSLTILRRMNISHRDFADTVRMTRKRNGLTQRELADELGVSHITIYKWESMQTLPQRGLDPEFVLELLGEVDKKYGGDESG